MKKDSARRWFVPVVIVSYVRLSATAHAWAVGSERSRSHAEARGQGRRNISQGITATGAAALVGSRGGSVGAQPMAASFTELIDALDRESRQILHHSSRSKNQLLMDGRLEIQQNLIYLS